VKHCIKKIKKKKGVKSKRKKQEKKKKKHNILFFRTYIFFTPKSTNITNLNRNF